MHSCCYAYSPFLIVASIILTEIQFMSICTVFLIIYTVGLPSAMNIYEHIPRRERVIIR